MTKQKNGEEGWLSAISDMAKRIVSKKNPKINKYMEISSLSFDGNGRPMLKVTSTKFGAKRDILGYISWFAEWKRYVWTSAYSDIIMDSVCLRDVATFLDKMAGMM